MGRVTSRCHTGWGAMTSGVSSAEYTLCSWLMKVRHPLRVVVFPDAVSPETMMDIPFSMQSHRYAAISGDSVPNWTRATNVRGVSVNLRMVKEDPCLEMSSEYMMFTREPSGMAPSTMGTASDTGLPMRSAMFLMYSWSSNSVVNLIDVSNIPNILWTTWILSSPTEWMSSL